MSELKRPASPGTAGSGASAEKKQKTESELAPARGPSSEAVASASDPIAEPTSATAVVPSLPPAATLTAPKPPLERLKPANETLPQPVSKMGLEPAIPIMPPSLELITGVKADLRASKGHIGQEEVGIIGYVGGGLAALQGVIKQRFTDFLVNEVGMDGEVIHLTDIAKPKEPVAEGSSKAKQEPVKAAPVDSGTPFGPETTATAEAVNPPTNDAGTVIDTKDMADGAEPEPLPEALQFDTCPGWSEDTTRSLRPCFGDEVILSLRELFVEGKTPPRKVDSGWGSRPSKPAEPTISPEEQEMNLAAAGPSGETSASASGEGAARGQGRDRGRGRGRGGRNDRGGRGGGRGGAYGGDAPKDEREVVSQPVADKDARAACHKVIREAFKGLFDSSTKQVQGEEGSRVVIKYARGGARGSGWGNNNNKEQRPNTRILPPYIHFSLQKTNRETQDALSMLSRQIGCQVKDLGIAGTKDKRAVTVQRVSLRRGKHTTESLWKTINGVRGGRGGYGGRQNHPTRDRGERGVRVGDFAYEKEGLDLGLLKGNQFKITLRNVQGDSDEAIDETLASLRDHGFINFYGMQRFGTSSVPTHITGLHILRGQWTEAIDSVLSLRQNEHPDCVRGRLAWLEDQDLELALKEMPRRCVAERTIWEFWKRSGKTTDKLGALSAIPRTLRTMYVHAYQSYIWNLVVSERIKLSSTKPLPGDLIVVKTDANASPAEANDNGDIDPEEAAANASQPALALASSRQGNGRSRNRPAIESSSSQTVRHLTEEDVGRYSIFDVVVPLPGFDVEYPKGRIGELYEEMMKADGLDVHHMRRDQREYSLPGSYRPIVNRPSHLTWAQIRYTDPNLPLVQSDEDRILNLNPATPHDPQGKFRAVVLEMTLGPAAYATMALREVTKEETASWWQTTLTVKGEDQEYRDLPKAAAADDDGGDAEGNEGGEVEGDEEKEEEGAGEDED